MTSACNDIPHDLFFQCTLGDEAVDIDNLLLAEPVSAIHRLQVFHRVPVVLDKDDRVCTSQGQAKTADVCGQK